MSKELYLFRLRLETPQKQRTLFFRERTYGPNGISLCQPFRLRRIRVLVQAGGFSALPC